MIKSMKDGKAMGTDKISTEMLRALDEENLVSLTQLCNIIISFMKVDIYQQKWNSPYL